MRHINVCYKLQTFEQSFKMDKVSDYKQKRFVIKITLYIYIFKV